MATNYVSEGKNMRLTIESGAESGDAFVVGDYLPVVLLTDVDSENVATCATEGVFDLSVKGNDGSSGAVVSAGDLLYWNDKGQPLDLDSSETPFGIALESVGSGETSTINVMLIPKAIIPGTVTAADLGASAVETAKIEDKAVTLAKIEDLTRGSIISGQTASNRPTELDISGDGELLIGDGTDVNAVAMSGDVTITNAGVTTIGAGKVDTSQMGLPNIQMVQFAVAYDDFSAEAVSEVIEPGVTIPKGAVVIRTSIDSVTKFEGASISAAKLTIGDSDGSGGATVADRYVTGTPDVFQAVDTLDAGAVSGDAHHDDDTDVAVTLTLTAGDCDELTAGAATVTIFYLLAVDHA